ncbi:MAG: ABC transporter ATP-binding protein [Verrucomicrobia bacterium]|nr:ABC transporter ATP-binding protein [Verrucomicrobiota bacterium]
MGPNGAGKTTLLRACLGLIPRRWRTLGARPTGPGAARRRPGRLAPAHWLCAPTAARPQRVAAHRPRSRRHRPHRPGRSRPAPRPLRTGETVDTWLDRLGLTPLAQRPFSQISGGEQRKTILARAMAQEPELLLLDEPTANLDLGWRERLVETIESLFVQTRLTVVLVCHELEVLPPACRHVWLLDAGRVAASGSPETVFTPERVATLYGDTLQALHGNGRHALVPRRTAHA